VGAILRYAVETSVSGVSLHTIGLILMIVGIVGIVLSLLWMTMWSPRRRHPLERRDPYEEPPAY
jgi:heme/copper-type cytochrome/quinol oxidase subunit 2